jgi:hypothetical protein
MPLREPTHPWMTHGSFAGSASSGSPVPLVQASTTGFAGGAGVLDELDPARPQGHVDPRRNI